jgi:hypothetical protein
MPSTLTNAEVVDQDISILEESPMTEGEEKELVIVKTAIATAYSDKLERDLAIGAGLLKIFRRKLYRGKDGGRTWEQWLADESAELTGGAGAIASNTSNYLRGFYQFRCEVLSPAIGRSGDLPLPASAYQMRPLLGQLDSHPEAAIQMWKAACSQAGKGKVPTHDQVQRAAIAYKANAENEARRLSTAQQEALNKANAARVSASAPAVSAAPPTPTPDFSPKPEPQPEQPVATGNDPTIAAWEIQKDDSSIDAGNECRRITQALNDAFRAIGTLRGILYGQINTYGSDYIKFLRQIDAGVYSLHNINDQVQQMGEDIDFITDLLVADVGEGELSKSTIDITSFPTKP